MVQGLWSCARLYRAEELGVAEQVRVDCGGEPVPLRSIGCLFDTCRLNELKLRGLLYMAARPCESGELWNPISYQDPCKAARIRSLVDLQTTHGKSTRSPAYLANRIRLLPIGSCDCSPTTDATATWHVTRLWSRDVAVIQSWSLGKLR